MSDAEGVFPAADLSDDARVRVFRRVFNAVGEFEGMEVDAYVVITDRHVVFLDTLLCPADMEQVMLAVQEQLVGRSMLVINSHADWDHCWGNAYFTGIRAAPIIASDQCLERLLSLEARTDLESFQQQYPLFEDVKLITPTITFSDRLVLQGGDLSIELLAAPGHQRDQIVAWIPELRLLLAFDAVEWPLPLVHDAESVPKMFDTLERLIALQPARVLCSHGKTTSPQQIENNLAYLREVEQRCQQALQSGQPTQEEMEHAAQWIGYPFEKVIAGLSGKIDTTFYGEAHETNVRAVLEWLMKSAREK